jgi:hypothetical protein
MYEIVEQDGNIMAWISTSWTDGSLLVRSIAPYINPEPLHGVSSSPRTLSKSKNGTRLQAKMDPLLSLLQHVLHISVRDL